MAIYILLLSYNIAIYCAEKCTQVSMAHLNALLTAGTLELIFELGSIIKIYRNKGQ